MGLLAALVLWFLVLVSSATPLAGSTYSCFSQFQSVSTDGCKRRMNDDDGAYQQETLSESKNMDFCVSGPVYGQAKQGSFGKSKNYLVSAAMRMEDFGKFSTSYGFLGLAFNMIDSKTYDIVYVRPHTEEHCWELGHVEEGLFFGRTFGSCDRPVNRDFSLAVKIENGKGTIYIDGGEVGTFNPFYPSINKVATALRNNMQATMTIKELEVCQEISCVSRNKAGETVVTKVGDSYQDAGMGACEACTCELYGQIKCGCRSAAQQGVSCTGGMIAAVGHDCCARCVPPSATCSASGDPHYRTFDGKYYDYMGSCTYCMVKTLDFEVRQKNRGGGRVSYVEYCQLEFDGDQYEMRGGLLFTPKGQGERSVVTPFKKYYNTEDYVICTRGNLCQVYIGNEKVLQIQCSSGYSSFWIHGYYYEKTQCMCGSWDGNAGNDFHNKEGHTIGDPNSFAAAWRVSNDDGCPNPPEPVDPCEEVSREARNWAEQYCSRYKQEPFKSCPIDVTQYFKNCMYDTCTDPTDDDNVCENAEAYATACANAGYPIIGWRSSSFCPLDCPDTFVYDTCGKGCHATCEDPNPPDCVDDACVEGCYCPAGTVLQDNQCIDSSDCKCLFEGHFIDNGQSWNDSARCETCTCTDGGIIECDPLACDSCPKGQVPISKSGLCCPICLADWTSEEEERIEITEEEGPVIFQCHLHDDVLVSPDDVTWKYASGEEINEDNMPENFHIDPKTRLILTINPAHLGDYNNYIAEVIFNGVVGQCSFELIVNPVPDVDLIDIDGESPRVVKEGSCQTMSVKVLEGDFAWEDFTWTFGPADTPVNFADNKYSKLNGGKTIKVCDAADTDEGMYQCCVTKDDVTDCAQIELVVLAVCSTEDKEYTEGDTWMEEKFMNCTCASSGQLDCFCVEQDVDCDSTEESYYDDVCEMHCSRTPAECLVTGDPHYKSFDGYRHDFQGGNCRFTVVKTEDFQVIGTNGHRDGNDNVSWNEAVDIKFKGITIHMGATGDDVTIDGQKIFLPFARTWRSKESIQLTRAGDNVLLTINRGNDLEALSLIWDGNSTLSTTVHGKYYEGTAGLCGVWDDNPDNDQTTSDGAVEEEVNDFGWSWKYVEEGDEVCKEEPQPEHPCDETFFPDAAPIADEACDILMAAPFDACHDLVDVEAALHNCKYDTCSCFDSSCSCHAVKEYVKECQEAGVEGLSAWRDFAEYCPMDCPAGLNYDPCGTYCPATCANKNPDCGKLEGKCNEGCFCPHNTYLQNGTCVAADECLCEYNGDFMIVGATWENNDTCSDCMCRAEGEIVCEPQKCQKCGKQALPITHNDECCDECVKEWMWTDTPEMLDVPQKTSVTLKCNAVVLPYSTFWLYSDDQGANWREATQGRKQRKQLNDRLFELRYIIDDVAQTDEGVYRCQVKKRYRTRTADIILITSGPPTSCTAVGPANGLVEPEGEVEIGATVFYNCEDDFYVKGEATAECQEDGTLSSIPTCQPITEVQFTPLTAKKNKRNRVNLRCTIEDKSFNNKANVAFNYINEDGSLGALISNKPKYSLKQGKITYTVGGVNVLGKPETVLCAGITADGSKKAIAVITIT